VIELETLEAIKTRRSIRKFTNQPIQPETITVLLKAAMQAPSAMNEQPWQFIVIDDKKHLKNIPTFSPFAPTQTASAAILVCADKSLIKIPDYWIQDCATATQNLLLAAHDQGLGAVWTGVINLPGRAEGFKAMLNLPSTIEPLCLVVLGYPAATIKPVARYIQERVHYNKWDIA
jgi:nitroreductase